MSAFLRMLQSRQNLFIILVIEGFLLYLFPPSLAFDASHITGGDTASHFPTAVALRQQLLSGGSLFTWQHGAYAGFPLFLNYFPLPFFIIVALSCLLPMTIAFKLGTLLAIFPIPPVIYQCLKNLGYRSPVPALGAAFSLLFLMMRENSMWGGNVASTLAGEFAYGISLALVIHLTGRLYGDVPRRKRLFQNAFLEALAALSNGYPLLQAGFGSSYFLLRPNFIRYLIGLHAAAFGMIGFWILPLIWRLPWDTPFNHSWNIKGWQEAAPLILWPALCGIVLGRIAGLFPAGAASATVSEHGSSEPIPAGLTTTAPEPENSTDASGTSPTAGRGASPEHYLWWQTGIAVLGFGTAPILGLVDIRFLPFAQIFLLMLGAIGWGKALARFSPGRTSACILIFAVISLAAFNAGPAVNWARWNYTGFETKRLWAPFKDVNQYLEGTANDGRVFYEHASENNDIGTVRAFEMLPYFSRRSTLEGLYMQSSLSSPFVFYLQSELSRSPSCPFPLYYYAGVDPDRAAERLRLFNVSQVVTVTEKISAVLDQSPNFTPQIAFPPFRVYAVNDSGRSYVEPLRWSPLRIAYEGWKKKQFEWFRKSSLKVPLLVTPKDGAGDFWRTLPVWTGSLEALPEHSLYDPSQEQIATSARLGDNTITVDTSKVMHPLWLKISYHPDWRIKEGEGEIYLASPSFMILIPHSPRVVLQFQPTGGIYSVGKALTFATLLFILAVTIAGARARRLFQRKPAFRAGNSSKTHDPALGERPAERSGEALTTRECGRPEEVGDANPAPAVRPWVWALFAVILTLALYHRTERDPVLLYDKARTLYDKGEAIGKPAPGEDAPAPESAAHARNMEEQAQSLFQDCIRDYPLSPVVDYSVHYLNLILQKEGKWRESSDLLTSFLSDYPDMCMYGETLYHLGLCARQLQGAEAARAFFWQTLVYYPQDPWAKHAAYRLMELEVPGDLMDIAREYYDQGDFTRALPLLEAVSKCGPESLRSQSALLCAYSEYYQSHWKEAGRLLAEWLRAYPRHSGVAEAWFTLAECQASLKEYDSAALSLSKALEADPSLAKKQPYAAFIDAMDEVRADGPDACPPRP